MSFPHICHYLKSYLDLPKYNLRKSDSIISLQVVELCIPATVIGDFHKRQSQEVIFGSSFLPKTHITILVVSEKKIFGSYFSLKFITYIGIQRSLNLLGFIQLFNS